MKASSKVVRCRSNLSRACCHGKPVASVYPDGQEDDGTWNGKTVICDPCYMKIGMPLRGTPEFITGLP